MRGARPSSPAQVIAFPGLRTVRGPGDNLGTPVMRSGAVVLAKRPSKPAISATVANLQRDGSLLLERVEEEPGDWYVQVWMRDDNTFQLEHRDGIRPSTTERGLSPATRWLPPCSVGRGPIPVGGTSSCGTTSARGSRTRRTATADTLDWQCRRRRWRVRPVCGGPVEPGRTVRSNGRAGHRCRQFLGHHARRHPGRHPQERDVERHELQLCRP